MWARIKGLSFGAWVRMAVALCICGLGIKLLGKSFLIVILIVGMFLSMDSNKKGGLSAYSIFNPNQRSLLGDTRASQFEPGGAERENDGNLIDLPSVSHTYSSRNANKPCPCGSGIKTKKCCGLNY
eukprot:Platyproteum_vivax@DN3923_c0_g1_i2.p1